MLPSAPPSTVKGRPPVAIVAAAVPAQAQNGDIAKVEQHLAAVQSMTANFRQTDARGRSAAGTVQLKRPGRIRFQYQGNDLVLVGNGNKLTFVDYAVGQKNSWDLNKTPLGILLAANPDINRIARIVPQKDPRILVVRARDARRSAATAPARQKGARPARAWCEAHRLDARRPTRGAHPAEQAGRVQSGCRCHGNCTASRRHEDWHGR